MDGCPDPASAVETIECLRNRFAMTSRELTSEAEWALVGERGCSLMGLYISDQEAANQTSKGVSRVTE